MGGPCVLSVAEKPSVAKELAAIIGKVRPESIRRQGFSPYNPIFVVDNCRFKDMNVEMHITSVAGHLMELEFDTAFKNWNSCPPLDLFQAPLYKNVKKEFQDLKKTLVSEAKKCSILFLWLDCDLEGENIAYEVIKVCLEANPRMDVYRARFSALIERDIMRTMRQPDRPNPHMNDAVDARQEIDLRIGAAFTRFQTMRLQKRFNDIGKSVISYGPCQFPTLGFVVDRDLRIKNFVAETFWSIYCEGEFDNPDKPGQIITCRFNWDRSTIYDELAAIIIYESCLDGSGLAKVISCTENPTSRWRPAPLNTIEFQILASRYLRLGSERAMTVAEALYQRGILSYPRTETNFFKDGFELKPILLDLAQHSIFGEYAGSLADDAQNKFQWPRNGGKDDQAHPPIHPTKSVELDQLENEDEKKVYELVCRHFLASCSKDAKGSKTTIKIAVPAENADRGDAEYFHASGLMVLEKNWLEVYGKYDSWNAHKVPTVKVGDTFKPKSLMLHEGQTSPPSPISESELIATMDSNGIGTDATIATHISTIQAREYANKDRNNCFTATKLGLALVQGYNNMGYQLNKPYLRAAIEADCQKVARGELRKEEAIMKCLETMKACYITCSREAAKLDEAVAQYFNAAGNMPRNALEGGRFRVLQANISSCGVCHEGMELRLEEKADVNDGPAKRYVFCKHCVKGYMVPARGELHQHEHSCPLCQFQVLIVRNPETNKDHTVCPYCFSNPPLPPIGIDGAQDFRCFTCANTDCELSGRIPGGDVAIAACPDRNCQGSMKLKKTPKGLALFCTNTACKSSWWLPKFVKSAIPQENQLCQRCLQSNGYNITKLLFQFILSKAPRGLEPEAVLCPSCDNLWRDIGQSGLTTKRTMLSTPVSHMPPPAPFSSSAASNRAHPPGSSSILRYERSDQSFSQNPVPGVPKAQSSNVFDLTGGNSTTVTSSSIGVTMHTSGKSNSNYLNNTLSYGSNYNSSSGNGFDQSVPISSVSSVSSMSSYSASVMNTSYFNSNNNNNAPNSDTPLCGCGLNSKLLTVMKESVNKGRQFYACPQPKDSGCNFFQWTDEPPRTASNSSFRGSSSSNMNTSFNAGSSAAAGAGPMCSCNEPTVLLTVNKETKNKGRQFYACKKKGDQKCDFFQWADEPAGGSSGGGGYGGYGSASKSNKSMSYGGGDSSSSIICSKCKQPGHYSRSCPNR